MRLIAVVLLLASFTANAQTDKPYAYKDQELGSMTYEQFNAKVEAMKKQGLNPYLYCRDTVATTRSCSVDMPLGATYRFADDKLASLDFWFNNDLYLNGYLKGLTEKFGEPIKVTEKTYSNRFGTTVTGKVWEWRNTVGGIVLEQYGHNLECGSLTYYDTKLSEEFIKRNEVKPEL